MDIFDILRLRKKHKKRKQYTQTPEQKRMRNMVNIMHVIQRGDFDESKVHHKIGRDLLLKEGYIDKDLNILKEIGNGKGFSPRANQGQASKQT